MSASNPFLGGLNSEEQMDTKLRCLRQQLTMLEKKEEHLLGRIDEDAKTAQVHASNGKEVLEAKKRMRANGYALGRVQQGRLQLEIHIRSLEGLGHPINDADPSLTGHGRPSPDGDVESQSKHADTLLDAPRDAHTDNPDTSLGMDEGDLGKLLEDLEKELGELEQAEVEQDSEVAAATPSRVPVEDSEEEQLQKLEAEMAM